MRRFGFIVVALFWLVMMGLLVRRDVVPPILEAREAALGMPYAEVFAGAPQREHVRMSIRLGENTVGRVDTRLAPTDDGGSVMRTQTAMSLPGGAAGFEMLVFSETRVGPDQRLVSFAINLASPGHASLGNASGKVVGNELHLGLTLGGRSETRVVPYDARFALGDSFAAGLRMPGLYVGKYWTTHTLDVQALLGGNLSYHSGVARVVRQEDIDSAGDHVACYVVETKWDRYTSTTWVNESGDVLRQQAPGGIVFVREPSTPEETSDKP